MVTKTGSRGNLLWKCGECGLLYREREWAERCEEWCSRHGTCNISITSHAVPINEI